MTMKKRWTAWMLCAAFLAVLIGGGAYISLHHHHECRDEGCLVCVEISALKTLLKNILPAALLFAAALLLHSGTAMRNAFARFSPFLKTLVTLKVKFSA